MYNRQNEGCGTWEGASAVDASHSSSTPPSLLQSGRGEIAQVLDVQEKATYDLMEAVKMLAQKLQPIISPPRPTQENAGKDVKKEVDYGSTIANCVQENTLRVCQATDLIAALVRDSAV